MYKFSFLIFLATVACTNKASESVKSDFNSCDTVFYSIKNENTGRFIDSVLKDYSVIDCNFKFSKLFDSLRISFSVTQSPDVLAKNKIASNRYFILKENRIKVVSDEDFFIQVHKPDGFINSHPRKIYFVLNIPGFEIIDKYSNPSD